MKTIIPSTKISNGQSNVLAVIGDQKPPVLQGGVVVSFEAHVISSQDYSPFGVTLSGRSWSEGYRYGFNGKEKDPEGLGGGGNTYDYGFRIYNAHIAKFLSTDPLSRAFPFYTPYQFSANMPVAAIDLDGLEAVIKINSPWYVNEIKKSINDGDVQRAVYLASKSVGDPAKDQYARKLYGADAAGTFNYNEQNNPEGLTVYNSKGDMMFNLKETFVENKQNGKVAGKSESWYDPILNFFGILDNSLSGTGEKEEHKKGGIMFTSATGQGQETRVAVDPSKVEGPINLDALLSVVGATKAASGGPAKNIFEGIARILDAAAIGKDLGDMYGIGGKQSGSDVIIFKCDVCNGIYQDSSGVITPSTKQPTESRSTHLNSE